MTSEDLAARYNPRVAEAITAVTLRAVGDVVSLRTRTAVARVDVEGTRSVREKPKS